MSEEIMKQNKELPVCKETTEVVAVNNKQCLDNALINDTICHNLITAAIQSLKFSYAPYSKFKVGAALLTKSNKIYTGCNVENATYTPTNCAERTAFFKAISEGDNEFSAIAIVGGKEGRLKDYCPPCGVCRQVMMEFCDPEKFVVILAKSPEEYWVYTLKDIMPFGFSPKNLNA